MANKKLTRGSGFMTSAPPLGMGLELYTDETGDVFIETVLDEKVEGPPKHVHGGFSAALLDEVMGMAVWLAGHAVVAVNIEFDLQAGVPLHKPIRIQGRVDRKEGRKVFATGEIVLADKTVAVKGRGIFVEAPQYFKDSNFYDIHKDFPMDETEGKANE